MDAKQRRMVRKYLKNHPEDKRSRIEILNYLSQVLENKGKNKVLYREDKSSYNISNKKHTCFLCQRSIKGKSIVMNKGFSFEKRFHVNCGPGTLHFVLFHPSFFSLIQYLQEEGGDYNAVLMKYKKKKNGRRITDGIEVLKFTKWYQKQKKEIIMAKKQAEKVEEKKSGRGSGLVPKERVDVPKELYKHPKIGKVLKEMVGSDDDTVRRNCRIKLRNAGFKLSDEDTWKKFIKEVKSGVAEEEDEEEEEEKTSKKKSGKEKVAEKTQKGKKGKEKEEEEDDEEEDEEEETKKGKKNNKKEETKKGKKSSKKDDDEDDEDDEDDDD